MAQSLALNQKGAVPSTYGKVTGVLAPKPPMGTTPQNTSVTPKPSSTPALGSNPGMLPSTPVKKITGVDGATTEFHAPEPITATKGGLPEVKPNKTPSIFDIGQSAFNSALNGNPTAAGNTSLQGREYFQNLVDKGGPSEKQAGQIWLNNHPAGTTPPPAQTSTPSGGTSPSSSNNQSNDGDWTKYESPVSNDITAPIDSKNINGGNPAPVQKNPISQSSFLGTLADKSQNASPEYTSAYNTAQDYAKQLADLKAKQAETYKNIEGTAGFMPQAAGIEGIANRYFAGKEAAINSGYQGASNLISGANTQQGLQQGAAASGAGLTSPAMQFGQLTNPQTGQPVSGGTYSNNPQLNQAVQQALQLVQNGADPQGSAVQSLLAPYQNVGQQTFNQALLGGNTGYNPTSASAVSQTNASVGSNYKTQAIALDTALKNLDNITPVAVDFITKSGLNSSDSPLYNEKINDYISSLGNSEAAIKARAIMNDIQKYSGQILAANSGTIPTDVSNAMASLDPSNLNGTQLQGYLNALKVLGENQLVPLQEQANTLLGSAGYTGGQSSIETTIPTGTPNKSLGSGLTGTTEKTLAGVGLAAAGGIENILEKGSGVLGFYNW